jgi:hypothetical protein
MFGAGPRRAIFSRVKNMRPHFEFTLYTTFFFYCVKYTTSSAQASFLFLKLSQI